MSFSPKSRTRTGSLSGAGTSDDSMPGIQYWRMNSPIGVPGPVRQMNSFSSWLSIDVSLFGYGFGGRQRLVFGVLQVFECAARGQFKVARFDRIDDPRVNLNEVRRLEFAGFRAT